MLRLLYVSFFGLSLASCDKPDTSDARHGKETRSASVSPTHHTIREEIPDTQKNLQKRSTNAVRLDPAEREKELAAITWDAIETNQELAHQAFEKLTPDSPEKIRLIQHYAMLLASQNIDEAIEWARTLESEKEIAAALSQIAVSLAETDPLRAANLLVDSEIPGRDFEVAIVQVIQRWAAQSTTDAADWVVLFPPGAAREAGIKVISELWLPKDAPTAFAWLDKMKDTELRKETARAMEGIILQQPQETRDAWLLHANPQILIELDQQREQALKDVGNNILHPEK
jgi:hypothetical protein